MYEKLEEIERLIGEEEWDIANGKIMLLQEISAQELLEFEEDFPNAIPRIIDVLNI